MKVVSIMRKGVVSLVQNAPLSDVVQTFIQNQLRSLPIVDAAQRVVGLITIDTLTEIFLPRYHELLRDFAVLEDKGQIGTLLEAGMVRFDHLDNKLILAADIMNPKIGWVFDNDTLLQAASRLQAYAATSLPVVDRDRKLVGVIADSEIILALLRSSAKPSVVVPAIRKPGPSFPRRPSTP